MIRFLVLMLSVTCVAAWSPAARADQPAEAGRNGPLVVCVGDAPAPSVLRFAFQAEPAQRFRPEVLRTATPPQPRARPPAARPPGQARAAQPPLPAVVYLPCING